jgi:leucyl aminopeptidase
MRLTVRVAEHLDQPADAVVTALAAGSAEADFARLGEALAAPLRALAARGDLAYTPGRVLALPYVPGARAARAIVVAAPAAPPATVGEADHARMLAAAAQAIVASQARRVVCDLHRVAVDGRDVEMRTRQLVAALADAAYRFDALKSKPAESPPALAEVVLLASRDERAHVERGIALGQALAAGTRVARDLGNLPGNHLTPAGLATRARAMTRGQPRLRASVLGEARMRELGMGALLAVSAGSAEEAKLIAVEYRGGPRGQRPIALVGKGITFDTGGISLKAGAAMDEMKFDMCGAAAVLGSLVAANAAGIRLNVVGIVAAAENMPGGRAIKPGDVVTSLSGQTVEILNTDAEGRLVLCDALTWAGRYKPRAVIDVATLTGAIRTALGSHASGLFANDDELATRLLAAGARSGDRAWRLPVWDDYQQGLRSNFADMANVAANGEAGSIVAACFLERFARKYHWAHLDIAGTAHRTGPAKGATGRPVPLLFQYLLDEARGPAAAGR